MRGIAALVVILYHYVVAYYPALYTGLIENVKTVSFIEIVVVNSPLNLFYDGDVAVCYFFILTGFLFRYRINDVNYCKITASIINRFFRLSIPVVVSLLLSYIVYKLGLYCNSMAAEISTSQWLGSFYKDNMTFIELLKEMSLGMYYNYWMSYNPPLWTMYYEFYGIIIPLIARICFRNVNKYVIYGILLLCTVNSYFFPFVLGAVIAENIGNNICNRKKIILLLAGIMLASYPPACNVTGTMYSLLFIPVIKNSGFFYHTIGMSLIMYITMQSNFIQQIFENKMLLFIGKLSYSMYLIHFIILNSLSCYLWVYLLDKYSYIVSTGITILLSYLVIILLAKVNYILIEQPISGIVGKLMKGK